MYKKKISLIEMEIVKNEYLDVTLMVKIFITELYDSENMTGNELILLTRAPGKFVKRYFEIEWPPYDFYIIFPNIFSFWILV